jgi:phage tail tape-measure protein
VTLVGYDWPEKQADPTLYVHDPAPWSGKAGKTHPVRLARAGTALFTDRSGTEIGSLAPYRRIAGGLSVKRGTEMALLEGAVILSPEIEPSVPWTEAARRHESPHFPWQLIPGGDGP